VVDSPVVGYLDTLCTRGNKLPRPLRGQTVNKPGDRGMACDKVEAWLPGVHDLCKGSGHPIVYTPSVSSRSSC
jgi:hypothetical protein